MSERSDRLRMQVVEIGKWSVCLPALAIWPFISALPAISLVGEARLDVILANVLFLITGFWAALVAVIMYRVVSGRMRMAGFELKRHFTGLSMGAYAVVWLGLYWTYKLL